MNILQGSSINSSLTFKKCKLFCKSFTASFHIIKLKLVGMVFTDEFSKASNSLHILFLLSIYETLLIQWQLVEVCKKEVKELFYTFIFLIDSKLKDISI